MQAGDDGSSEFHSPHAAGQRVAERLELLFRVRHKENRAGRPLCFAVASDAGLGSAKHGQAALGYAWNPLGYGVGSLPASDSTNENTGLVGLTPALP